MEWRCIKLMTFYQNFIGTDKNAENACCSHNKLTMETKVFITAMPERTFI